MHKHFRAESDIALIGIWDFSRQNLKLPQAQRRNFRPILEQDAADGHLFFATAGKSYVLQSGPEFHLIAINDLPDPNHPYGVRGVGEVPIVPPCAAIANAIYHAVGVRMTELPMSPGRVAAAWR